MSVKVEKQENSKVVLEFTMSKEEFNKNLDKAFIKNAKYFKVPGFRNGKVPRAIVEKMYGETVLFDSVIEDTVDEAYRVAIEENKLEVVSKPELDIKQIGKDKDLIYTVTVFVKPEATVKNYKGLEVKKFDTKVAKKDVDAALDQARDKNARTVTIEDRALEMKDISTIDFEGFVDGVAFEGGKGENFELTIGSGQFIPGFEEQLVGMKIGEEKEITVKFPKEYHSENLADKDAMFKVKLISIKSKVLPELDDEFVKDVSEFNTLEEYKKDLESKLKEDKEKQAEADKEAQAVEKLVENTEVTIPDSMIHDQMEQMVEQFNANLSYQGLNLETYCQYVNTTVDAFKETLRPQAEKDVKLKLALEYIAKTENITATEEDINAKIDELAKEYGNENSDSLKNNENIKKYMSDRVLQDKTLKIVLDNVVIK
ncbi:MAG: trigger factor [Clostridia bacterium]|nr:trigger factor [Clostridia bacterium]